MLEEWGQAIQDAIKERDDLRRRLALAQGAKMVEEQLVRDVMREKAALRHENEHLRRDLEGTQNLYREATETIMGLRTRIRFLEDIAHKTGHIVRLDSGGTL
jgi:regulator of replication initiation timing